MKSCPVGVELFYADGQTDMTKLIVAFRNFAKRALQTERNAHIETDTEVTLYTDTVNG